MVKSRDFGFNIYVLVTLLNKMQIDFDIFNIFYSV